MKRSSFAKTLLASTMLACSLPAWAGQAPGAASDADVPVSHRDRVYAAEQFSNTVSVTDPADNKLVGVIRLGDPQPGNFSPLYNGQVLVHGMGFSPDHKTIAVVSIGSNSVTFIDTATNAIKHTTYVGRSPHEAFFTPDGNEVWVTVRGEDYVAVLDGKSFEEKQRIKVPAGPGMQIFSPDGKQVWFTLKDTGKTMVFDAQPPFSVLKVIDTGPISNHVNFAHNANGTFAYVTVGGLNEVQVFRTDDFSKVATIPVGKLPHGVWPSGDGSRVYVGLENADAVTAIDTISNKVIATSPIGQAPQAITYVPNAVPEGDGKQVLQPLGVAGQVTHLELAARARRSADRVAEKAPTSVSLFDQGLTQVLEASVTGLQPKQPYVLALSDRPNGGGKLEPLSAFMTDPAGSAIVNAVGPIRQIVRGEDHSPRRYPVIAQGTPAKPGSLVQLQAE